MAGPRAPLTVQQGAQTPVKLCYLEEGAENGVFCESTPSPSPVPSPLLSPYPSVGYEGEPHGFVDASPHH